MMKALLIGGSIVGGVFAGFVAYEVIRKKRPRLAATVRKKGAYIGRKTSEMVANAKQGFSQGFTGAYSRDIATKQDPAAALA